MSASKQNSSNGQLGRTFAAVDDIGLVVAEDYPGDGSRSADFTLYDGGTEVEDVKLAIGDMSSAQFVGFSGFGPITSLTVDATGVRAFNTIVSVDGVTGAPSVPEPRA